MTIATPKSFNYGSYISRKKAFWNEIAISYSLVGYGGGIVLICLANIWLNILGVIFLSHSLIYSAYLSHEFMHGTIFKKHQHNIKFGQLMMWMNGGCYYGLEALRLQHVAHHVNRVDVFTFDIPQAIQSLPKFIQKVIYVLEWCYFPIVAFWTRWRRIIEDWRNIEQTKRITLIFLLRSTAFIWLSIISVKALLLYFFSYVGMITVLRFFDAFQHTYEAFPIDTKLPMRDWNYEQSNTYSNLISFRYPWLNLLVLNFSYHNAHHAVMTCPWHSIAELDEELRKNEPINYISWSQQLANYHRYRVVRLQGQGNTNGVLKNINYENFYGAIDVSFITLY